MAWVRRILSDEDPLEERFPEALAFTERLVEGQGRRQPAALHLHALALEANGRKEEAVPVAQEALKLLPEDSPDRAVLASWLESRPVAR